MQVRRLALALFALLAVAAVVAGCGGGDSSTDGSTGGSTGGGGETALTKAQFISKADGICKADDETLNKEVETFAKEEGIDTNKEPSEDEQAELVEGFLIPNLQSEHDEIADLTPPQGDEGAIEKLLDNLEGGIEEAEDDPASFGQSGGGSKIESASKEASAYGLKVCGGGGG